MQYQPILQFRRLNQQASDTKDYILHISEDTNKCRSLSIIFPQDKENLQCRKEEEEEEERERKAIQKLWLFCQNSIPINKFLNYILATKSALGESKE